MPTSLLMAGLTAAAIGQVSYGSAPTTIVENAPVSGFSLPRVGLPSFSRSGGALPAPMPGNGAYPAGGYYNGGAWDQSNPASANAQGGQYGIEELYPWDSYDNWVNGYWQHIPTYGGHHHFRPYNYKHVLSQTQTAAGWGSSPTHAYSHEYFRRKQMMMSQMGGYGTYAAPYAAPGYQPGYPGVMQQPQYAVPVGPQMQQMQMPGGHYSPQPAVQYLQRQSYVQPSPIAPRATSSRTRPRLNPMQQVSQPTQLEYDAAPAEGPAMAAPQYSGDTPNY